MNQEQVREQVLSLTQSMLTAAEADDWENVISSEQQRRNLLTHYVADADPRQAASCIDKVLASDSKVMNLGKTVRDNAAKELKTIKQGRCAQATYGEVSQG